MKCKECNKEIVITTKRERKFCNLKCANGWNNQYKTQLSTKLNLEQKEFILQYQECSLNYKYRDLIQLLETEIERIKILREEN